MSTNKVTKRANTKKTKAKKTVKKIAKKTNKKSLVYADNQTSFWVNNGQILNSLVSLKEALDEMEKAVYEYHALGWQNDFAQWVETVLKDTACANDLRKSKTAKSAKTVVVRHLKYYTL